jgi:hypothetical protein
MIRVVPGSTICVSPPHTHSTGAARSSVTNEWRKYDVAENLPFHSKLLNDVGLVKMMPESVTRATDLRFPRQFESKITR